jgi:hypothetical protein
MANKDSLDQLYELSLLYDFYGDLLKENHKQMFEDYVLNNYSLGEIAEERGISRQGVHDSVKRTSLQLQSYEEKLGLLEKFRSIKEKVMQIQTLAKGQKSEEIYQLSRAILKDL